MAGSMKNGPNVTVSNSFLKFFCYYLLTFVSLSGVCSYQVISGLSISSYCTKGSREFNCIGHLLPGTKAHIHCKFGYEKSPSGFNSKLTCLDTGEWDLEALECQQDCGRVTSHSTPLLSRGQFFLISLIFLDLSSYS